MEFPRLVYKCPGSWPANGATYATLSVNDEEARRAALESGWHDSLPLAIEAFKAPRIIPPPRVPAPEPAAPAGGAPTRDELEQKATELGLKFDGRHKDATLLKMIEDALKEKAGDVDKA